nr:hypothetical protein BaRGS_009031 [Batillaria attramentaria]
MDLMEQVNMGQTVPADRVIQKLQEKAQAGYPIRPEDIPPPVTIPTDDATRHIQDTETVRLRINQYKLAALKAKRAGQTDLALQHMRVVKEETPEPEINFNGKSLAEELSAFLEEMPSPEHRRQDTEGGGSDDAKLASEQLTQQMEEEKQRLRSGGYEAWLAYLGQVEEDVGNINSNMKQAREMGMEDVLGTLIIKKELAEREMFIHS